MSAYASMSVSQSERASSRYQLSCLAAVIDSDVVQDKVTDEQVDPLKQENPGSSPPPPKKKKPGLTIFVF